MDFLLGVLRFSTPTLLFVLFVKIFSSLIFLKVNKVSKKIRVISLVILANMISVPTSIFAFFILIHAAGLVYLDFYIITVLGGIGIIFEALVVYLGMLREINFRQVFLLSFVNNMASFIAGFILLDPWNSIIGKIFYF